MQDQQKPDPTKQDKKPTVDNPPGLADYFAIAGLAAGGIAGWYLILQVMTTPLQNGGPAPYGNYGMEDIFNHPGLR